MTSATLAPQERLSFQTHPDQYRHWRLAIEGSIATLSMAVDPDGGLRSDYELKLNSYDLGVDVELADAIQRLRFEHPEVRAVVLTGALDRVFCAGANIVMLRTSAHSFKVNFCKYTNETRLGIEDASDSGRLRFLAALNGTASGGGYELALAADRILLVDDRNSAVSFPEVPLLGVLPGTGGLTRITDKRKLRRDRCDVFSTVAEGIKGKRAVAWNLVDDLAPLSKWDEAVARHAQELAEEITERPGPGVPLPAIEWQESADDAGRTTLDYGFVQLVLDPASRTADLTITAPDTCPTTEDEAVAAGAGWWVLEAWRQLDQAILELRMNFRDTALVLLRARGSADTVRATDSLLCSGQHWFVQETAGFVRRVLKRLDLSSKSFYAVADEGTTFTGTFLELLLAADRSYVLNDPDVAVHLGATEANRSGFPMSNGLTRLETRFYGTPEAVGEVLEHVGQADFDAEPELVRGLGVKYFIHLWWCFCWFR